MRGNHPLGICPSIMATYYSLIINVFECTALCLGLAAILCTPRRALWLEVLIATSLAVLIVHLYLIFHHSLFGFDYQIFWKAGCDVWRGMDPYDPPRSAEHALLINPPTALPLFALFAALPFRMSLGLWTFLVVTSSLAIVGLAWAALKMQSRIDALGNLPEVELPKLSPQTMAGLAICLTFSEASLKGLDLGQLSVFVTAMLLAAQSARRPIWAGVCLSFATVKVATMLPFLLLFLRLEDCRTRATLGVLVLGACLLTGPLTELPGRLATVTDRIAELSAPGMVNDYPLEGTSDDRS